MIYFGYIVIKEFLNDFWEQSLFTLYGIYLSPFFQIIIILIFENSETSDIKKFNTLL